MRFIYALIGDIPFVLSGNDINNFWVLRIIYVFLLSASCFITYLTFTRIGINQTHSLLLAATIGLSPASQGMIGFGYMCFAPLGTICSALAFKSLISISLKKGDMKILS